VNSSQQLRPFISDQPKQKGKKNDRKRKEKGKKKERKKRFLPGGCERVTYVLFGRGALYGVSIF
jgi:conjugal transfer/entry exclusion protein